MKGKKKQYRSIDAAWDDGTTANQTEEIKRMMAVFSAAVSHSDAVDIETRQIVITSGERRRAFEDRLRKRLRETVFVDDVPTRDGPDSASPPPAGE